MSWVEPQEITGSDLETMPLAPRPHVALDREPNSEGWKSWVVTAPSGSRYLLDTLPEAHDYARNLAIVHAMFNTSKEA